MYCNNVIPKNTRNGYPSLYNTPFSVSIPCLTISASEYTILRLEL